MRIIENIKTFLYDKKYFINIYDNKIHVFNYIDLENLTKEEVTLRFEDFVLHITGLDLHVTKMAKMEMLITGNIENVRFKR